MTCRQLVFNLIITLLMWQLSDISVVAQTFGCGETETFDQNNLVVSEDGPPLPQGWRSDVDVPQRADFSEENQNVRWALSDNAQYCDADKGNLISNDSNRGNALCASSDYVSVREGNEEAGMGYSTAIFTPFFDTSMVEKLTINYKLDYQNFTDGDELVFVIKYDGQGDVLATYDFDRPNEFDEFELGHEPMSTTIDADKLGGDIQFAWRYYDTSGDSSDWYVQIDDIEIICDYMPTPMPTATPVPTDIPSPTAIPTETPTPEPTATVDDTAMSDPIIIIETPVMTTTATATIMPDANARPEPESVASTITVTGVISGTLMDALTIKLLPAAPLEPTLIITAMSTFTYTDVPVGDYAVIVESSEIITFPQTVSLSATNTEILLTVTALRATVVSGETDMVVTTGHHLFLPWVMGAMTSMTISLKHKEIATFVGVQHRIAHLFTQ